MSFLNQLKVQATSLQRQQGQQHLERDEAIAQTEAACAITQQYLEDLARQLNVIEPPAPAFSLDGKTPWPAMKLCAFRADTRRKMLAGREVTDYIAMGWSVVPQSGEGVNGSVSVNFPPELERVEARLAMGLVKHDRIEVRHPEKSALLAIRYDYQVQTRGNVALTADHDKAVMAVRLLNPSGFGIVSTEVPVGKINTSLLDELAKLIVSQPSRFA